jgi:putative membrane protein
MLKRVSAWLATKRLSIEEWVMLGGFGLFAFVWPFGIVLLSLDLMPFEMEWMGSVLLALLGVAAGAWLVVNFGVWGALAGIGIYAAGMLLEGFGVMTGLLFGQYEYTGVLMPQMPSGVPLPIGFAWVMVVVCGLAAARWFLGSRGGYDPRLNALLSLVGALLSVGLDFLLEPVTYHVTGYWTWQDGEGGYYGVPWSNFITWFGAVLALNLLLTLRINMWGRLRWLWVPVALYVMVAAMFGIVNLAHGFWVAGLIGVALLVAVEWRMRPVSRALGSMGRRLN